MTKTEELIWLLGDFKKGDKNFLETINEIEKIYARAIGAISLNEVLERLDEKLKGV